MNLTAAEKVLTSTKVPEADQCQLERCSTETAPPHGSASGAARPESERFPENLGFHAAFGDPVCA